MPRNYFQGDPYWRYAPYPVKCTDCGEIIRKSGKTFYYPKSGNFYCTECGSDAAQEFKEQAEAEYEITGPESDYDEE